MKSLKLEYNGSPSKTIGSEINCLYFLTVFLVLFNSNYDEMYQYMCSSTYASIRNSSIRTEQCCPLKEVGDPTYAGSLFYSSYQFPTKSFGFCKPQIVVRGWR